MSAKTHTKCTKQHNSLSTKFTEHKWEIVVLFFQSSQWLKFMKSKLVRTPAPYRNIEKNIVIVFGLSRFLSMGTVKVYTLVQNNADL